MVYGNLQKRASFGYDGCHINTRANNKAFDINSIRAGWANSRMSNFKALSWGIFIIAFAGLVVFLLPRAAEGETGTIPATVDVRNSLTLTKSANLRFGNVHPGETDGTVVVTTSNVRFAAGGARVSGKDEHHHHFGRAVFTIFGEPNATYQIGPLPTIALHDNRRDPIPNVTALEVVNLISFSTTIGAETFTGQIGPNGVDTVFVGGTLIVPTGAKNGKYEGSLDISINYL